MAKNKQFYNESYFLFFTLRTEEGFQDELLLVDFIESC